MPIFIKTEKFKKETLELSNSERKNFLLMHKEWVKKISQLGHYIHSGYLINEKKIPGGGGLLILEAKDYLTAKKIIENDPMIKNNLVIWDLQEWISVDGSQPKFSNHLG
ncbi:YciI family protein [Prochlorococcus marinus]|uniref:YciI family protein n=1 Tax=Prochlorococcus marinus TaxID=1219 RepID=UPI0022B3A3C4|nr:hypothetical protein [Prochlorococcus marinus]